MKIVNIIPQAMSGESHQDSGSNIAVNPSSTNEIVISAYTANPGAGSNAPVYVSTDGGDTWALKNIVPDNGPTGTTSITVKFGLTGNQLYAGIIKGNTKYDLDILRTTNPAAGATMTELDAPKGTVEQPYVAVTTVSGGADAGRDRLYVGMNVLQDNPVPGPGAGKTSTIRQSMDAQAPSPAFNSISLDRRNKSLPDFHGLELRNGPQVRPAVHGDGTVYAVFYSWKKRQGGGGDVRSDVVIVRDDNWGQSPDPYGSLIDSGDGQAGQRVAVDVHLVFDDNLGQERVQGELAIAVDPGNSSIVYVAWAEQLLIDVYMLHLRQSIDRGQTWSQSDLLAIPNGKNPALAINNKGQAGFLYQQLAADGVPARWVTHLAFSADAIHWSDTVLANMDPYTPVPQFYPYIGDYADLMAVGNDFYGVFCANNTPSLENFPQGVTYQRNHNFSTKTLFNLDGVTPVAPSIDPFFFTTGFIPPALQFPSHNFASVVIILFGIIGDGGGAYIDGSGHIHIVGPGDPGPGWAYLVNLAEWRLASALNDRAGLRLQRQSLQNIVDLATAQIARINGQLGQTGREEGV